MFTLIALAVLGASVLHALATKHNALNASARFANAQAVVLAQQEVEVSNLRTLDNQPLTSEFPRYLLIARQLHKSAEPISGNIPLRGYPQS